MAEITTKDVLTLEELKNLTGQAAKAAVIYDTSTGEPSGLDVEIFINMDASIGVVDASVQALEQQASDLSQVKADKVSGATAGNFSALDASGNLVDSLKKPADFEPVDETILRQADVVDSLTSESATAPLSAKQGKNLQDEKEALRYDNEAIDLDNLGDVRLRSIDVDNLPKISGFDMFVISTTAPSVAPDFIPQIWVDTTAKKAYIAVGVSTSADFIALN